MYNIELTANKMGFRLYPLVMSVCPTLSKTLQRRVETQMFACTATLPPFAVPSPRHTHTVTQSNQRSEVMSMGL